MDIKFVVTAKSKNRINLEVVQPKDDKGQLLKDTGSPDYGQCALIVSQEQADQIEVGEEVDANFEFVHEAETEA